ncbi:MAG: preprotein translocase subunit SecA [Patescibacteria group bacterium]
MSIISKIFGDSNSRFLGKFSSVVLKINSFEPEFEKLDAEELKLKTAEFKERLNAKEALDDILPEAYAAIREASKRTLGQRHFDVQILGGAVLHQGRIAEMKTGEGKTLVATLPAYLNALAGYGVHVVTVNDYLARRDVAWMGQIYNALGMSVSCINHEASYLYDPTHLAVRPPSGGLTAKTADEIRDTQGGFKVVHEYLRPCSRKEAYDADITYGTNNEFGFDYLRDNLAYSPDQMSQRGHNFAIVDEVDSILIDEARTPLIISAPDTESGELYRLFSRVIDGLEAQRDYTIDEKMRASSITDEGINRVEKTLGIKNIYAEGGIKYVHHMEQALRAKTLYKRDKDYVIKDGEVIIVDEFTGRLMPGRRWSEGLHQAVEAKEGVAIQKESRTVASITFQNYFRLYEKLSGMTGTAATSAEEFHKVYNLEVAVIPTNKLLIRHDSSDKVFATDAGKWRAVLSEIKKRGDKGQPVLVGTVSIEKNEILSAMLKRDGVKHNILNAKNHEAEAQTIAQAGKVGAVTVATNMAGRGVDIVLGGNPTESEEAAKVIELGGLFVLGTSRHDARRIDNQLRGRSGRQGDPGETQFFISFDDDLLRVFGSERIKNMMTTLGIPEDEAIENKMVSRSLESAQAKVEGFNFDARKHLLEYDDVMNKHRTAVYRRRKEILFARPEELFSRTDELFLEESEKEKFGQKIKEMDKSQLAISLKFLWLQTIDHFWVEHLEIMEYMRSSVRLRAYGQRDPLIEYKNEAARLFHELEDAIEGHVADIGLKMGDSVPRVEKMPLQAIHPQAEARDRPALAKASVGRNDPCPCGSGKKYKKCHGT